MPPADATRTRLLAAAGPLFAQHGFRDASVQAISRAAGCNVAAINYHFGSKQDFYATVLAEAHRSTFAQRPMPVADADVPPAQAFADWLRWWMQSLLAPQRPVWLPTLMAREMVEPTPALDRMVERSIRPMQARLQAIVRRLLPARTPIATVRACTVSVIGQVMVHKHAAPVLGRLRLLPPPTARGIAARIEHVLAFSLAGIAAVGAGRQPPRSRR